MKRGDEIKFYEHLEFFRAWICLIFMLFMCVILPTLLSVWRFALVGSCRMFENFLMEWWSVGKTVNGYRCSSFDFS